MLIKEVKRHIADFNSQPCFSALVTACHVILVLLYILLMSRILHGEAEFIFLWLTGQKSLLCQYYLSYSEGSQGRESLCALVKSRMLFFSLSAESIWPSPLAHIPSLLRTTALFSQQLFMETEAAIAVTHMG